MSDLAPAFDWAIVLDLNAEPLFDEAATCELFLRIGRPDGAADKAEAVAFKLSELGKSFAFDLWHERKPSASREEQEAEKLAATLGAALSIVGLDPDAEPSPDALLPTFGPGGLYMAAALRGEPLGKAATMNALRAVHLLRLDALAMAGQRRKRSAMKAPKRGRDPENAIKRLVAGLAAVYFDVWDKVPSIPRSKATESMGELTGTFVGLMVEVANALMARGLPFYATAESLEKHWRRLPPEDRLRFPPERIDIAKMPEREA